MAIQGRILIRKFGRFAAIGLMTTFLSIGVYRGIASAFAIRIIEIESSGIGVQIDEKKMARNLLFFPSAKVRSQLLADNPLLKDITIKKKFPHTLLLVLTVRKPVALLVTGSQSVGIDRDGVIIPQESASAPGPVIRINVGSIHSGQALTDRRISISLHVIEALTDSWHVEAITTDDASSLRAKVPNSEIIFTQDADPTAMVTTLQTLLAGFRIKGSLPKVIDLRFDKPVITF